MVGLKEGWHRPHGVQNWRSKVPWKHLKKTALQPNIESSAFAAEVLWRWRRLGPASEISFFYVLPLQRYHCVGILCFMPNPSQNSHILPAVIRRSPLTDYFGQNLHQPLKSGLSHLTKHLCHMAEVSRHSRTQAPLSDDARWPGVTVWLLDLTAPKCQIWLHWRQHFGA